MQKINVKCDFAIIILDWASSLKENSSSSYLAKQTTIQLKILNDKICYNFFPDGTLVC